MKHFFAALIFGLAMIANYALAQTNEVDIERIVITSSRSPEEIKKSTKSITILDNEDILMSGAKNLPDLLRSSAGIHVYDYTGTGKSVNIDLRGFGETGPSNVLVMIDSRRINAIDLSNTDWSQISLSQIERVEIVRGSSSVLYGDNATSGVINIITKKEGNKPFVQIEQKGGSFNTRSTAVESSGSSNKNSWRLSAEYFKTAGYRINNDLERNDFGAYLSHNFSPNASANITFGYHNDTYGLPGSLSEAQILSLGRRYSRTPQDKANSEDYFTQVELTNNFDNGGTFSTGISGRVRQANSAYYASSWESENQIVTLGLSPKYSIEKTIGGHLNKFLIGLDIYQAEDNIKDGAMGSANDKIIINKRSIGIYGQDEISVWKQLSLKLGFRKEMARYDFHQITQVDLKNKADLADEVYEIGLNYLLGEDTSIYTSYGTSLRYPLVDEYFSSNTYGFGGLNTALKPQYGKDVEIGIRHELFKEHEISFNYFRHNIKNEIYYNPLTWANTNHERTTHQGIEIGTRWHLLNEVSAFLNYTFTHARFTKGAFEGNIIPGVPDHKTSFGFMLTPSKRLNINLITTYIGSKFLISDQKNAFKKMDGYITLDTTANYIIRDGLETFLAIYNIFDTEYSEYGVVSNSALTRNFYPAAGRSITAGIKYKF